MKFRKNASASEATDTARVENPRQENDSPLPSVDADTVDIDMALMPAKVEVENAEPEAEVEVPVQAGFWKRVLAPIKGIDASIRRHPHIAVLPLIALGLMIGLGVWGVMAASQDSSNTKKSDATASAVEVASAIEVGPPKFSSAGFSLWLSCMVPCMAPPNYVSTSGPNPPQLQMKETFTPAVTLQLMIEQNPSWAFWSTQFAPIVDQLMARVRDMPGKRHAG